MFHYSDILMAMRQATVRSEDPGLASQPTGPRGSTTVQRVLAVAAHPDDLEQLCGGTLARYARDGHVVTMCTVALGDRGSYVESRDSTAARRSMESRSAAARLGAELIQLDVPDGEIDDHDPALVKRMVDAVRTANPDVVITHNRACFRSAIT